MLRRIAMEPFPQFNCHQTKRLKMLKRMLASRSMSFNQSKSHYPISKLLPRRCLRVMKFLGRLVAFMLVVFSFPQLRPVFDSFLSTVDAEYRFDPRKFEVSPVLFHDLANEGLLRVGKRALFLSNEADYAAMLGSRMILFDNEMDHISISDLERQSSVPDNAFHFAFTYEYHDAAARFIDRTLRVDGLVAIHLGGGNLDNVVGSSFRIPSNYRIAYIRRFDDSPVVGMKKIDVAAMEPTGTRRRLCGLTWEKKIEALNNLEDVLLEPPRAATGRSSRYLKKTRFLPDLTGDSLEGYPRRVFIDVGPPEKDGTEWFVKNYPTRNLDFNMYKMDTVATSIGADKHDPERIPAGIGMSEWLRKNVKEEEYVVVKADAEVVEEIMNGQATGLVDELFQECNPKGKKKKDKMKGNGASNRAYWECLALYGRLRDEGVAVHQWWD